MAWYSNAAPARRARAVVGPDGSPSANGQDARHAGNAGRHARPDATCGSPRRRLLRRLAVGYPAPNQIRVWRVGATNTSLLDRVSGSGSPAVAIAAASDGRLWVLWTKGFGDPDVFAAARTRARRGSGPS